MIVLILAYLVCACAVYAFRRKRSQHPFTDALLWPVTLVIYMLAAVLRLITTGGNQ